MLKIKKYRVSTCESLFYEEKIIKAKTTTEALCIYCDMLQAGEVEVVDSEMGDGQIREV
jgi:hypothetical protein